MATTFCLGLGFRGQAIRWRHSRFRGSKGCCHGNRFWLSLYGVHIGATWRIQLNRPCAAAMRPYVKLLWPLVTFRVRRSRGEMYIGHDRLCLCVCQCQYIAAFPHYCTGPDVTWGMVGVSPGCALLGWFAIGARVSLLWQHSAEREMLASACTRMPGFFCYENNS